MMRFKLILILLFVSLFGFSQTKETALRDAKITAKATLDGDYKTVVKHTLPGIIKMMGGKENTIETIKASMEGMKSNGLVFEKSDVVSVSEIVKEQNQYRCYIQNNNQLKMGNQRIKSKSYLLGIYNDTNKNWVFVEAKLLKNKAMIDQILPDFKTSLKIPENEMKTEVIE